MLLKPCDNKKTHFRPTTKTLTNNIPNNQERTHTKYLYSKTITNKYKHIAQTLLTYIQPTHSQYQINLKLHLKLAHRYQTENSILIVKVIVVRIIIKAPTSTMCKINNNLRIKNCKKTPSYTFFNKKTMLQCGNIESNPGP
jgi:hypothetical protein